MQGQPRAAGLQGKFDDGEAKATADRALVAAAEKPIGGESDFVVRNAGTLVLDKDDQIVAGGFGRSADHASVGHVMKCVLMQVADREREKLAIGVDGRAPQ